jgi:putative lipoic acid-binding regulatory protein
MKEERPSLLEFPCVFPIKAMGKTEVELDLLVIDIVRQHVNHLPSEAIKSRLSKNDKFISVTITIEAISQKQLDSIYQQLNDHPHVMMTL